MKNLRDLLHDLDYQCIQGTLDKEITAVIYDSKEKPKKTDFLYVSKALSQTDTAMQQRWAQKGISVLVVQDLVQVPQDVTVIQVEDTRYALACISAAWFGHPAEKLKTIGITGTKGKTTTTYLIKSILENAGHKTGLIGTIETIIGEEKIPSANTTPESYLIQDIRKDGGGRVRQRSHGGFLPGAYAPQNFRFHL